MNKRPEKTEQTKADLQEAFWQLYAASPIDSITIQQICDRAGYNRGTFYLHYHDIYELLSAIEEAQLEGMAACVEACMQRIEGKDSKLVKVAALTDVMRYYEANKKYVTLLLGAKAKENPQFIVRLKDRLKPLWRVYVIRDTEDRTAQEIDLMLEYVLTGALFMISLWLQEPGDVSAYQIGHLVYDTAIRDVNDRVRL